jgi:transposase
VTAASAPAGVTAPVQYGPRLTAIGAYLWHGQFLSRNRTAQVLAGLFGVTVSPGAVTAMVTRVAAAIGPALEAIRDAVTAAPAAHFDETGFRVAGKLAWVHSASAGKFALITVHPRRGREGMDAAGVLPAFGGIACHDAWAPYDTYPGVAGHALCCAHALRELQAVTDAAPAGQWCWSAQAADALRQMKRLADAALTADGTLTRIDASALATARHRFRSAVLIGEKRTAARAGPLMAKHHARARRLRQRQDDYLRFTTDPRAPFDNNEAEVRHEVARGEWATRKEGRLVMAAG